MGEGTDQPRGRRVPSLLLIFLVLTLVVINLSNWLVLSRVTAAVDEELGLRLITVATAVVTTATAELLLAPDVADDAFVEGVFRDLSDRNELENVFLVDPDGVMLFDLAKGDLGDRNPFLDLDFVAFTKATAGIAAATPSLEVDGVRLKGAYAPVENWDSEVEAVLGVTAGGGFFARIPALRRTLFLFSIGSAALVVLLAAAFFGMTRRLSRTERALWHSETLSAMGMMAAGVAHEIRNPLAIISGTAARLKKKYSPPGEDVLFDYIPEEVERLNGILEGYLRFARDEPLTFTECDLKTLVERTTRLVEEEFSSRGIQLCQRSDSQALPVRADPQRIQQVILNLLLNAAQAMPGGGDVNVELAREGGRRAIVRVSDSGVGLDERELRSAFQPFFTTKEKGSGLGLVLAKRIVVGHEGVIRIANQPQGGAVVTVELPLHEAKGEGPHSKSRPGGES